MDNTPKAFEQLQNGAYNIGYDLTVNPDTMKMKLVSNEKDLMPEIEVTTIRHQDSRYVEDYYTFDSIITFPTIDTRKFIYYDSLEYYINKWAGIGKFISSLTKFVYHPEEWEED